MLRFLLGPLLEENCRRALVISHGSFATFVERPIGGTLLGIIGLIIVWQILSWLFQQRSRSGRQRTATSPSP